MKTRSAARVDKKNSIPNWVYDQPAFDRHMKTQLEEWSSTRQRGAVGLEEFAGIVQEVAEYVLQHEACLARTSEHKFQIASAMFRNIVGNEDRLSFKYMCKQCRRDPDLMNYIELDFDENGDIVGNPARLLKKNIPTYNLDIFKNI